METIFDSSQDDDFILEVNTASHRVHHGFRLFENFFLHERAEVARRV